jgi:hypothetical protein
LGRQTEEAPSPRANPTGKPGAAYAAVSRTSNYCTRELAERKLNNLGPDASRAMLAKELVPILLAVSKCPDFLPDRGHTCGLTLSDSEKRALIEFLKTI